jgi:hypothetical protein
MLAVEGKERVKRENRTHHQHETKWQSPPPASLRFERRRTQKRTHFQQGEFEPLTDLHQP